jgi:hypothetical protein
MSAPSDRRPVHWDEFSELHMTDDGGGVLSSFKAIRQGPLAELVRFVSRLPEQERQHYAIVTLGERRLGPGEIMMLSRRPDFPHS